MLYFPPFSQKLHLSYSDYIRSLRISEACRLLTETSLGITEISYQVGFPNSAPSTAPS
ncbi:MAG: helix-turn-helix domain-containing protein [Eisenbergiella sp.]